MVSHLEAIFPGLAKGNYSITSSQSHRYNCIGWAAADTNQWWWPGPDKSQEFWPASVPREETVEAFCSAFASLGYSVCQGENLEPGFEKVAIFSSAIGEPTHATRQLGSGRWTSKLGKLEDIEHDLHDLVGTDYGVVAVIMKRTASVAGP
jgi:hypothetical protein